MVKKAVILTYAPINDNEQELLKMTQIFKLALNHHAEALSPDARIITDYVLKNISKNYSQKIITVRDRSMPQNEKIKYYNRKFKGATILSAIDYLTDNNYDEILIVGNNKVNNLKFRSLINDEIDKIKDKFVLYQYSDGNFNLPVKSVSEFLN